jgi:ferredoxin-NADP reductase
MNPIDRFLNKITMYQLLAYGLSVLVVIAMVLGITGRIAQPAGGIAIDAAILLGVCYAVNKALAIICNASSNYESWYITALILTLIVPPENSNLHHFFLVALVGLLAMTSKYLLVYRHHHLFNPAAIAVLVLGLTGLLPATWWVGSPELLIPVLILGLCVIRKIRRVQLFGLFFIVSLITALGVGLNQSQSVGTILHSALLSSPLIFFGTIMLTEPETLPVAQWQQYSYAILAGALFSSQLRFGSVSATPEMALIIANVYSLIISPKRTINLQFRSMAEVAPNTYEFTFTAGHSLYFQPGQYITLNLQHKYPDGRGTRRTFSIASAPAATTLQLALKSPLPAPVSSFKQALLKLSPGEHVSVSSIAGTFVLPENTTQKVVFLAGGIGITPFLSMIRDQVARKIKRDVVLLHFINAKNDECFTKDFAAAEAYGLRTVPVFSDAAAASSSSLHGHLDVGSLQKTIPDFTERSFFISGPPGFVDSYRRLLIQANVPRTHIRTDHFAGY